VEKRLSFNNDSIFTSNQQRVVLSRAETATAAKRRHVKLEFSHFIFLNSWLPLVLEDGNLKNCAA
jgi:hypothetical protein